jgi:uncharacterized protein YbaP (TraB family)
MVMEKFEKMTGLPPLSHVMETFNKLPDSKRLKSIKEILTLAENVSKTVTELDKVVSLINALNDLPLDKLKGLEKVLKRVEAIIEKSPDDMIQKLIEFITELKEG